MLSRRLKFLSFCAAFEHQYKAKLPRMTFPYITSQILQFVKCLRDEHLILTYRVDMVKKGGFSSITLYFSYTNNNTLLFSKLRPATPRLFVSAAQLNGLLHRKASLVFPIFILWLPALGLVTDRQLVHIWLKKSLLRRTGGELLVQIEP